MKQNEGDIDHCFCHFCCIVLRRHIYLQGTENIPGGKQSTTSERQLNRFGPNKFSNRINFGTFVILNQILTQFCTFCLKLCCTFDFKARSYSLRSVLSPFWIYFPLLRHDSDLFLYKCDFKFWPCFKRIGATHFMS